MRNGKYIESEGGVLMPVPMGIIGLGGVFKGQHIRDGKVIDEWEDPNLVVNEGLNHVLNTVFHGGTPITTWYLGIFEGNYTPGATGTRHGLFGGHTVPTWPISQLASGMQAINAAR